MSVDAVRIPWTAKFWPSILPSQVAELPAMSDDKDGAPKASRASFGSGLGSDFKPLGKRIVIGPRQKQRKLIARLRVDRRKPKPSKA